jgi:outer membrane protein assembly factor BamB
MFDPGRPGAIATSPVVNGDRIYLATIHDRGMSAARGVVLALDRRTRQLLWSFDNDGAMLHTISTPVLDQSRLYLGEGMHGDLPCHLYCLDAVTGRRLWAYPAGGHIESSPRVAGGLVYFGAGDDGVYALDAVTGKRRWHYNGPVHVDTCPAVVAGRLFAGGGLSRRFETPEAFCLDARTGGVLWRQPTELPVWGPPVVAGERVLFGLGNGRLIQSAAPPEKPAGALLCLAARTGHVLWCYRTGDAVFGRPAIHEGHVWFTCRDGHCYCVEIGTGRLVWKQPLGSPAVTTPAVDGGRVYVVAMAGQICCLEASTGRLVWEHDVTEGAVGEAQLVSSPVIIGENGRRQVLFGGEMRAGRSSAVLYCLEEQEQQ